MLQRPEIGSRSHIMLWVDSKPADGLFPWDSYQDCACGQYARAHGFEWGDDTELTRSAVWDGQYGGSSLNAI
jgi:hypothetical protein